MSPTLPGRALALLTCAAGLWVSACDGASERRTSCLLITLDTTRADALSCYGVARDVTPQLDRLAADGRLFLDAITTCPETLPAHASMMTGLQPIRHSVRRNAASALPAVADTLAERALAAGYQTAAFLGAVVLDTPFGLAQGFEVYDVPERTGKRTSVRFQERAGREVVDRALAWLARREPDRPFLLWVHLFDAHAPYEPPTDLRAGALAGAPYLGEVAEVDRQVGRLLDTLRASGALDSTLVVALGDHGEGLDEHGEHTHGTYCYQPTLAIPLIVRAPLDERRGARVSGLASAVDVFPTVLGALALGDAGDVDGQDLLAHPPEPERGLYFECYTPHFAYGWSPLAGWIDARGKYIHSSAPELYDWRADPREERDLASERPQECARYRAAIARQAERPALATAAASGSDAELVRGIQALGYAAVGLDAGEAPHPLAASDRFAPAARVRELAATLDGELLGARGDFAGAERLLSQVVAENPRNVQALDHLVFALVSLQRYAEAQPRIEQLLALGHVSAGNLYYLGYCHYVVGRKEEALAAWRRSDVLDPDQRHVLEGLARVLGELGRAGEANELRARLAALERKH
jgi:arylsulfatase A-like enzyme